MIINLHTYAKYFEVAGSYLLRPGRSYPLFILYPLPPLPPHTLHGSLAAALDSSASLFAVTPIRIMSFNIGSSEPAMDMALGAYPSAYSRAAVVRLHVALAGGAALSARISCSSCRSFH